ncbi:MAG: GTPase HflX [Lentisphaeria bacterium]|nr:GTPase HflX [Lentisphaeria bacterium]
MIEVAAKIEVHRAFLVGIASNNESDAEIMEQLDELAELVRNVDLIPLEPEIVHLRAPHAQYMMGSGKAAEIAQLIQECEADCVIFDTTLTPSQQRNWERLTGVPVTDREEIILDIFARRAHTHEAVLQVALARAEYSLPRLSRAWSHFSRQRGGGATNRGEGEAQLETDRRLLRRKIQQLTEELEQIRKQRTTGRKARLRRPVPQGAIVGYTNVGKSSLLHALTGADVLVKDQLFATLDPTARKVDLGNRTELVLIDTVGFVRKLPHSLVEAFKSTLEEAVLADFLLLMLDISSPQLEQEWETTLEVLKEIGADEKKIQVVFNKIDLIDPAEDALLLARLKGLFPQSLFISTATGEGFDLLKQRLALLAGAEQKVLELTLPPDRADLVAFAYSAGKVYECNYLEDGSAEIVFSIDAKLHCKYKEFIKDEM